MEIFKYNISFFSLLSNFISNNRHVLITENPEKFLDRLNEYARKKDFAPLEKLAHYILLLPYFENFNALARIYINTIKKAPKIEEKFIELLNDRLIPEVVFKFDPIARLKKDHAWLIKIFTSDIIQKKEHHNLRVLYLNTLTGIEAYNLACVLETVLPPQWTYTITGIDPLEESVYFAREGSYPEFLFNADYPYKPVFKKSGNQWVVYPEVRSKLDFQHLDLLTADSGKIDELIKGKYDLIVADNAYKLYTLPIFHKIIERLIPALDYGGFIYPGFDAINQIRPYEQLDFMSVSGSIFYIKSNVVALAKNEEELAFHIEEESSENLLIFALASFMDGNYDKVIEYTGLILSRQVDNRRAISLRCLSFMAVGDFKAAQNQIRQLYILNPDDFDADIFSAYMNHRQGRNVEALYNLKSAVTHFKNNKLTRRIKLTREEEMTFTQRWESLQRLILERSDIPDELVKPPEGTDLPGEEPPKPLIRNDKAPILINRGDV